MVGKTEGDLDGSRVPLSGLRWAPLVPLVLASSLGIVVDRFAEPWGTTTWAALALGAGAVALVATSRDVVGNLAVLAAFWALGGGWHHYRWSDRGPDDLGGSVTETPRPAWVRGVVREALGVRQDDPDRYGPAPGPGSGTAARDSWRTRFVVDLTAMNDGRDWRPVSGRAIAIVAGDRGDVLGGEGIEAIGQVARIAGPLNPGEFDYRQFLRGQGIDLRLTVDDPDGTASRSRGSRLAVQPRAGSASRLDPRAAGGGHGPEDRAPGGRVPAGPPRGRRSRGQRRLRPDRHDAPAGDLGAAHAGAGRARS